jgi:hypothetical protein
VPRTSGKPAQPTRRQYLFDAIQFLE